MQHTDRLDAHGTASEFAVVSRDTGVEVVVEVRGELDMTTSDALWREILQSMERTSSVRVVVDLTDCAFIAAAGITVLLRARRRLGAGRVAVRGASPTTVRVLHLTGVSGVFDIEPRQVVVDTGDE